MGDDGGFDFRPEPERREPRKFEPPPWEKEAFPERYRERTFDEQARPVEPERVDEEETREASAPPEGAGSPEGVEREGSAQEGSVRGPSEAELLEMMAGLSAEEPDTRGAIATVTMATSLVVGALGMVLIVWAMAAFVRAGSVEQGAGIARTGAVTMGVFGVGFVSAAAWMLYRLVKR